MLKQQRVFATLLPQIWKRITFYNIIVCCTLHIGAFTFAKCETHPNLKRIYLFISTATFFF